MLDCPKCGSFNYNDEQCPSCGYASDQLIALTAEELLRFMIAQNRKYLEIENKNKKEVG
jgi:predicted nucleic-acid-binding Zn-ribbon protein